MESVDALRLNFNPNQMTVLNLAMAFLMFSVALDVRPSDFKRVVEFPKSILVGLIAQYVLFPLLTLGLIRIFSPPSSVALGMVLVSMCPSGNITNFLVHYSRSNIVLSVTLNSIVILLAAVITPAGFLFWSKYVPGTEALRQSFTIGFGQMAIIVLQLILLPLLVGMWMNVRFSALVEKIRPWVQKIALFIFFTILILAVFGNMNNMVQHLSSVFVLVAIHNLIGLGIGYVSGRLARLPERDCRTLSFESGVHNTALGLVLIFSFFGGLGGMALIAAWWGIWDLVTGISLAEWWRRRAV